MNIIVLCRKEVRDKIGLSNISLYECIYDKIMLLFFSFGGCLVGFFEYEILVVLMVCVVG